MFCVKSFKLIVILCLISVFLLWQCDNSTEPDETDKTMVAGTVTNVSTSATVTGAVITDGTNVIATSGTDGKYSAEIAAGTYTFTCTAAGYVTAIDTNVAVIAKQTTMVNFALHPFNIVEITDDITVNTTWESDSIYVIKQWIYVQAVLIIEAGTIIKFESGKHIVIDGSGGGIILANGSNLSPIIFTSIRDDSYGGDTNSDGTLTTPASGDWRFIEINGTNNATVFNFCRFFYSGGQSGDVRHTLELGTGTGVTITNCTFANNEGGGTTIEDFYGVVNAYSAGSGTVIQNNVFYNNDVPLLINGTFDIDDSNVFHNPDNAAESNDHNGIFYDGYRDIEGQRTWGETEVPFVIFNYDLDINAGISLTLTEDVIIKLDDVGIDVNNGLLLADASSTNPIIFTSYKDDTYNGDTNSDGAATSPLAGDWRSVWINGTNNASSFEYCKFYYSGNQPGNQSHTISLGTGTNVNITNCTFVNNKGGGTTVNDFYGVIYAYSAGDGTIITNNIFFNNEVPMIINGRFDIDDSNVFHNPNNSSEVNTYNGIFFDGYRDIEGQRSWSETEVPFVIFDYALDIPAGNSLSLANNVIVKFAGSGVGIDYEGDNLLNYNNSGVWFTSYKDDSNGGDTNGDGTLTTPADGDWNGIYNNNSQAYEAWSNILYDNQ